MRPILPRNASGTIRSGSSAPAGMTGPSEGPSGGLGLGRRKEGAVAFRAVLGTCFADGFFFGGGQRRSNARLND